jgi:hypothetical protein
MRINTFLAEVEEPVRAIIPQVTRTVKAADEITSLMEGPVRATAPRIERIVETLGSPGFTALPNQLGELMQRLGPLAQLAENAGGLFGAFRVPGLSGTPKPTARPDPAPDRSVDEPALGAVEQVARASAKRPAGTSKSTRKSPARSAAARSATPQSSGAKKRAAKGATPAN